MLYLSGPPQVLVDGAVVHGFESEKALALLAYLALVGRPVNRDYLAGLFWGELDTDHSRGNLRRVLHNLTHRLPGCLEVERHSVRFVADQATVDVQEFRRHLAGGDLDAMQAALTWCGGDLLEGIALANCPEFELWLVGQRERWRAETLAILEQLIDARTQQGDYASALTLLDRALALAPWVEHLHRHKMLLLARRGHFTAALKQYELCRHLLADELGAQPSHELEALHTRIEAARQRPHNVAPQPPPALVGRVQERAELSALLLDPAQRLITITGPGGVGKSTLAQAVASETGFAFLDGVLYAHLLTIAHPRELPGLLLQQLGLASNGQAPTVEQAVAALQARELLIVLDNAEHLLPGAHNDDAEEAAILLRGVLEEAPHVKVLITSRQRLALRAERVFALQGLAQTAEAALALFWQRLAQYDPQPGRSAAEDAAAAQICTLLDGSPLGIELAAAQSAQTGVVAVAVSLHASLDHLRGAWVDLPARQRSLRALFDSSWSLLAPAEQRSLAQLALFAGEFSGAAARAVAAADAHMLARLVDHSLLRPTPSGCYAFHPAVHQFAADRLAADAAHTAAANARFIHYYLALLAGHNLAAAPARHAASVACLSKEWLDVRAAWRLLCANPSEALLNDVDLLPALDALYHFCNARSLFYDGRELLASLYAILPVHAAWLRGEVGVRLALFHLRLGEPEPARRLLEEQLQALRTLRPRPTAAIALGALNLATVALHQDRYDEVQQLSEESGRLYRQTGDRWGEAMALNVAGVVEFNCARYDRAQCLYTQALAIFEALGDTRYAAKVLHNLATSNDMIGDHSHALAHFTAALEIHRQNGEQWSEALAHNSIGFVQINLGLYPAAHAQFIAAGQLFANLGGRWGEMIVLANRCLLDYLCGDLTAAEQHGRRAHHLAQTLGDRRYLAYAAHRLGNVLLAQQRWDEAAARYQEALAIRRTLGQTNLALESQAALARVAWQRGDPVTALPAVASILSALDAPPVGMDEPLRLYLTCYEVLAAASDPRAQALIQTAATLLQARAERMTDVDQRAAYAHVAVHRTILSLAQPPKRATTV